MASNLFFVLVLIPLAFAWPADWEKKDDSDAKEKEMYMNWKKTMEQKKGEFMEWKEKQMDKKKGEFMEWKEKHETMVEKFKDYQEDKHDEMKEEFMAWKEKQETMKKKFMEYKKDKKEAAKDEFMEWKQKEEWMKKMEGGGVEDKMELMKKFKMMNEKMTHIEHFEKMMKMFTEKKHHFAISVLQQTLEFCNCQETNNAMYGMTGGEAGSMGGVGDMDGDEGNTDIMMPLNITNEEDMKALAEKVKKLSTDQQKMLFMKGLKKTICAASKAYVLHMYQWKQKYLN